MWFSFRFPLTRQKGFRKSKRSSSGKFAEDTHQRQGFGLTSQLLEQPHPFGFFFRVPLFFLAGKGKPRGEKPPRPCASWLLKGSQEESRDPFEGRPRLTPLAGPRAWQLPVASQVVILSPTGRLASPRGKSENQNDFENHGPK